MSARKLVQVAGGIFCGSLGLAFFAAAILLVHMGQEAGSTTMCVIFAIPCALFGVGALILAGAIATGRAEV